MTNKRHLSSRPLPVAAVVASLLVGPALARGGGGTVDVTPRPAERRVDVQVDGKEPWIPAVQYFGTKGFFAGYDARMGDLLKSNTGKLWTEGLGKLRAEREQLHALYLINMRVLNIVKAPGKAGEDEWQESEGENNSSQSHMLKQFAKRTH